MNEDTFKYYPRNDYRSYIQHSAKGTTWGKHKYIKKVNDRYFYPEDLKSGRSTTTRNIVKDDDYYEDIALQSLGGGTHAHTNEELNEKIEQLKAEDQRKASLKEKAKQGLDFLLDIQDKINPMGSLKKSKSSSNKLRSRKKKVTGTGSIKKKKKLGLKKRLGKALTRPLK